MMARADSDYTRRLDTRPQIERALSRARVACLVGIGACTVLGGCLAASVAIYLTKDRSST